jgi:hypothetical protein
VRFRATSPCVARIERRQTPEWHTIVGGDRGHALEPCLEEAHVLRGDRVPVAAGRPEGVASAERVEVGREATDQVEDDLLDPLCIRLEVPRARRGIDRLGPSWTPRRNR